MVRFKIGVDGKWRGDSYATKAQADRVAEQLRKATAKKVDVFSKGGPAAPEPKSSK